MSKTKKIKRLENKIKCLQSENSVLNWQNRDLMRHHCLKLPSDYYTPRPSFRSSNIYEEREYNRLLRYVYAAMDNEYRRVLDTESLYVLDDIKFIVYMSRDIVGKLQSISNYHDFGNEGDYLTFRGHEVVTVTKRDYVHFVRVF